MDDPLRSIEAMAQIIPVLVLAVLVDGRPQRVALHSLPRTRPTRMEWIASITTLGALSFGAAGEGFAIHALVTGTAAPGVQLLVAITTGAVALALLLPHLVLHIHLFWQRFPVWRVTDFALILGGSVLTLNAALGNALVPAAWPTWTGFVMPGLMVLAGVYFATKPVPRETLALDAERWADDEASRPASPRHRIGRDRSHPKRPRPMAGRSRRRQGVGAEGFLDL